ncbi:unnamed protein product [Didymodactylos carnosus]|uniref:Cyclic nucleotide-binding domain-containing protein n=1 Tax=Didymodactylos carnosus TaxID=1234261 RepID=A0A8S2DBC5_9BILA|nr:unnamed protein product [Didymodactylos carnosus]CAF3644589.1 unnamed protein product [Didymodactylos carnosus]
MSIEIPDELPLLLRNFTLSVLRSKPQDIIAHAVTYFTQLQQQRSSVTTQTSNTLAQPITSTPTPELSTNLSSNIETRLANSQHSTSDNNNAITDDNDWSCEHRSKKMNQTVDNKQQNTLVNSSSSSSSSTSVEDEEKQEQSSDNDEAQDKIDEEFLRKRYVNKNEYRRVSVAAEKYNPEEDNDSDTENTFYPKTNEQRKRLKDAVIHSLLFRTLESSQIDQILNAMYEKEVTRGEVIIKQGDDGDNFYVIDKGTFDIYVSKQLDQTPVKVGEYDNKGSFGELALMYNQPRSATIIAATNGILWVMKRQTFRKLVLKYAFRKRQLYENFLKEVEILKLMNEYERSNVADALIPIVYEQNDLIIKQGDYGDRMFFIENGECDVIMNKHVHKTLSKGDYFGELALVNNEPRSATVKARTKAKLAYLEVESFERLMGPCMDLICRNMSKYTK